MAAIALIGLSLQRQRDRLSLSSGKATAMPHRIPELRLLLCIAFVTALLACSRAPEGRTRKTLKVSGTVIEQVDGPPYSYLRLKTEAGEVWAMVPTTRVGRNERVTVVEGFLLKDFETGLPGRRFDVVMGSLERHR